MVVNSLNWSRHISRRNIRKILYQITPVLTTKWCLQDAEQIWCRGDLMMDLPRCFLTNVCHHPANYIIPVSYISAIIIYLNGSILLCFSVQDNTSQQNRHNKHPAHISAHSPELSVSKMLIHKQELKFCFCWVNGWELGTKACLKDCLAQKKL